MGGDITVRSTPGLGTTFTATIALAAADADARPQAAPAEVPAARRGAGPRLLVVDDNRTNRFVIEKMLAGTRFEMRMAEDGASAIAAARAVRPDLVLMDISMPGMDGFETCRRIRAIEIEDGAPRACILALSANGALPERRAAREAGMDGFLTKPVRRDALIAAIEARLADGAAARGEPGPEESAAPGAPATAAE